MLGFFGCGGGFLGDFVVGFFGVLGLEVFVGDFGEGAAAVVDLRGLGGTTGRWVVSFGGISGGSVGGMLESV